MDRVYLNNLFDVYQNLLTDHEKEIFINYYQDDLSLGEISTNNDVTRSAVFKTINNITNKLNDYENKLHVYHHNQEILVCLDKQEYDKIRSIIE